MKWSDGFDTEPDPAGWLLLFVVGLVVVGVLWFGWHL